MPFSGDSVANCILDVSEKAGTLLTPAKLQQLGYLSHGWYLAIAREPLFNEGIQAGQEGPVVRSLHDEFEEFGNGQITRRARQLRAEEGVVAPDSVELFEPRLSDDDSKNSALAAQTIDRIWQLYGTSPFRLSNMTRGKGTPWDAIHTRFQGKIPKNVLIPDELIREYFFYRLRQSRMSVPVSLRGVQRS